MWSNLKRRYAVANAPKIRKLKVSLANCKQNDMDIIELYSKILSLWNELEGYIRCPQCICKKCECNIGAQVTQLFEEEKTHQFLCE